MGWLLCKESILRADFKNKVCVLISTVYFIFISLFNKFSSQLTKFPAIIWHFIIY